jgi:tRNA 2-thiouridine synthesizing protein E
MSGGTDTIRFDEKGYLLNISDWSESLAGSMAEKDGLILTSDHWAVINYFREYFAEFEIEPPMRAVVRWSAGTLGQDKVNSRYLYQLFPDGPVLQASRYGGLPRPLSCI